jgi:chromosome segregation ATPase
MVTYKAFGIGAAAIAAVLGLQTYDSMSTRHALEDRIGSLERDIQTVRDADSAGVTRVASDLGVVSEKLGITERDLEQSRKVAEQLRQEHAKTAKGLRQEIASNSKAVGELKEEANTTNTKITEVQTDATNKIGVVSGDVQTVKLDLDSTKTDLAASRKEMGDMRDSLGREIAKNSGEVAELRRRGERDYFEFDIHKSKDNTRIADIQLQLKKADTKARKYDLVVQANDSPMEKKGVPVNEPITFLVGKDRVRYELVVYSVDKDRIRGYVSTPKDKVLSAEGPSFRH